MFREKKIDEKCVKAPKRLDNTAFWNVLPVVPEFVTKYLFVCLFNGLYGISLIYNNIKTSFSHRT